MTSEDSTAGVSREIVAYDARDLEPPGAAGAAFALPPRGRPLLGAELGWDAVLTAAAFAGVGYTRAMVAYQSAYVRPGCARLVDLSCVLEHDGKPVGVWPVSAMERDGRWTLGSQEGPLRAPLLVDLPESLEKRIVDDCLAWAHETARALGIERFASADTLRHGTFGCWHRKLLEDGGDPALRVALYVDLSWEKERLWSAVRRRYRGLVNKGKTTWKVAILEGACPEVFAEYRALHLSVAGRLTRSGESWDLQHDALVRGDAFLVTLRDDAGRLVGGGLFATSASEGLYAVGAYDRELFDKPLGHVVQWSAIEHMKARGLRWYYVGERFYPSREPAASDKELQIAHFKEGFATHFVPHVEIRCPVRPPTPGSPSEDS